jgi:uncharacterized protein
MLGMRALLVAAVVALALAAPVLAQTPQTPARDWLASGLDPDQVPTPVAGEAAAQGAGEASAPGEAAAACQGDQPYAVVQIDGQPRLSLELATTPEQRERGLMFRSSLDPDSGMLFVYNQPATEGYWMRNTLVPLSIAWLDHAGGIVDIQDMQPQTDDTHTPAAPYWYALETNQGWFQAHGVSVGQVVQLCLGGS